MAPLSFSKPTIVQVKLGIGLEWDGVNLSLMTMLRAYTQTSRHINRRGSRLPKEAGRLTAYTPASISRITDKGFSLQLFYDLITN